jgi:hypothetical protein
MEEIRTMLDRNECTLKHFIIGGGITDLHPELSWDSIFESVTINNLTHLHLIDIRISHFALTRIFSAHKLQTLTLNRIRLLLLFCLRAIVSSMGRILYCLI